jgi:hypothetical protein
MEGIVKEKCPLVGQHECDSKMAIHQWIIATLILIIMAVLGFYYTKLDKICESTTYTLIKIQRIEDKLFPGTPPSLTLPKQETEVSTDKVVKNK